MIIPTKLLGARHPGVDDDNDGDACLRAGARMSVAVVTDLFTEMQSCYVMCVQSLCDHVVH